MDKDKYIKYKTKYLELKNTYANNQYGSGINKNMPPIKIQENITRIKGGNLTVGNAIFNSKNNQFYILTNDLKTFQSLQDWPDEDEFGRLIKVVGKDNISKKFFVSIKGIDPGVDINKDQGIIEAFAQVGIKKAKFILFIFLIII